MDLGEWLGALLMLATIGTTWSVMAGLAVNAAVLGWVMGALMVMLTMELIEEQGGEVGDNEEE